MNTESVAAASKAGQVSAWGEARRLAHACVLPGPPRRVSLTTAHGLTLAEDLRTRTALPPFDTAAMDGFAVSGPGPWRLTGPPVLAGTHGWGTLPPGSAVPISTGAPVPARATSVLRVEDAQVEAQTLRLKPGCDLDEGRHIRYAGEYQRLGDQVAGAGDRVSPALVGLAASCGYDSLLVHIPPRVTVLVTGDELLHRGRSAAGHIRDAIGPMIPGLLMQFGADLAHVVYVADSPPTALERALHSASTDGDSHVIVVTGASSVGETDRLRAILNTLDVTWWVDGVHCRPGHPQLLAVGRDRRPIVGLPGNPFAAFVAAHLLLAPLVAGMTGRPLPPLPRARVQGTVARPTAGHVRFAPVKRVGRDVLAIGGDQSGHLRGAAHADALAVVPPDWSPDLAVELIPC